LEREQRRAFSYFALLGGLYALLTVRFWWVCDDAFISFRYARNWASGCGLRYNLGDALPVEGYSNFLWVALCALFEGLRVNVTFWAPLVSFACGMFLLYRVYSVLRKRFAMRVEIAALAIASLAFSPPFALWSTGGLETMAFAWVLFETFERLILRRERPAALSAGFFGLALALLRVEGIAWSVFIGLLALWTHRSKLRQYRKAFLSYFGIVIAGFALYFAWRYSYYQRPMANTFYAKTALSIELLIRGLKYVILFMLTFVTPLAFIPGWLVARRGGERDVAFAMLALILANLAFAIVVGGDFMAMGRLLVPGLVVFNAFFVAWLVEKGWNLSARAGRMTVAATLFLLLAGLLPAWDLHLIPQPVRSVFHFRYDAPRFRSELEQWAFMRHNARTWKAIGLALNQYAGPGDTLVEGAIGNIGYYSGLYIYDRFGLVTPKVTRFQASEEESRSPGHDRQVPAVFFLENRPTFLHVDRVSGPQAATRMLEEASKLHNSPLAADYVPDFPMPALPDEAGPSCLFVYRAIPANVTPGQAWTDFEARLGSLVNGSLTERVP